MRSDRVERSVTSQKGEVKVELTYESGEELKSSSLGRARTVEEGLKWGDPHAIPEKSGEREKL